MAAVRPVNQGHEFPPFLFALFTPLERREISRGHSGRHPCNGLAAQHGTGRVVSAGPTLQAQDRKPNYDSVVLPLLPPPRAQKTMN
jgi:hypothetical protein